MIMSNIFDKYSDEQHSIAKRLLSMVFSIYLIIAIIMTIFQMALGYRQAENHIIDSIKIVAETANSSLSTAIWDLNQEQVESIIEGLTKLPEIGKAVVRDEQNMVMASAIEVNENENDKEISNDDSSEYYSYTENITHQHHGIDTVVGSITLYSSPGAVIDRVGLGFVLLVIGAIIKTFFLGVIFLFFSHNLLHRPITKLTNIVKTLDLNNYKIDELQNIGVRGENELSVLRDTFYEMAVRLKKTQDNLQLMNETLERRVEERTTELAEKQDQLVKANKKLEEISITDPLTGWHNRRFLDEQIGDDFSLSIRAYDDWKNKDPSSQPPDHTGDIIYLIDIDHFKRINDTYGHAVGDLILKQFCQVIRPLFRDSDYAVRWGGEEFMIIARFPIKSTLEIMANRIVKTVSENEFDIGDNKTINITCSVGVTCFPFDVLSPTCFSWQQTVSIADMGLYMAKENGRNAWVAILKESTSNQSIAYSDIQNNNLSLVKSGQITVTSSSGQVLSYIESL